MQSYRGQMRREGHDLTPTKSSWNQGKEELPSNSSRYQKSELSYCPSQSSHHYEYDRYEPSEKGSRNSHQPDTSSNFNETYPFRLKSYDRDECTATLRIQMQKKRDKNNSSIVIHLTDDRNPKFLWSFAIRENDFLSLKSELKLLVDFNSFLNMLEEMILKCRKPRDPQEKESFYLLFDIKKSGDGTFSILQTGRYKESVEIYLCFKQSNDEQVKDYLSEKILNAAGQIEEQLKQISYLENALSSRKNELETTEIKLKQEEHQFHRTIETFKNDENAKINQIKEEFYSERERQKKLSELEIKTCRDRLEGQIHEFKTKYQETAQGLDEARQKIITLESEKRQLSVRLEGAEKETKTNFSLYSQVQKNYNQLQDDRIANEKVIIELNCNVEKLRSQLEDKKTIISSTTLLKETNLNQIYTLEIQNQDCKKQLQKFESKISNLQADNVRLQRLSSEWQEKYDRKKDKLQSRGEILKAQEKEINQLQHLKASLARENEELKQRGREEEMLVKKMQMQVEECEKRLQEENALVIHLQRQLNERPPIRGNLYSGSSLNQPSLTQHRDISSNLGGSSTIVSSRISGNYSKQTAFQPKESHYQPKERNILEPVIMRYEADKREDRSKSPLLNNHRLNQQREPDEEQGGKVERKTVRPVKFKMSNQFLDSHSDQTE